MDWNVIHGLLTFSESAAAALVSSVWQGLVLAAGIWICLRMLPKAGAATRFAIWMAAFGVLAVLPLVRLPQGSASGVLAREPLVHADVRWSLALTALWLTVSLFRAAGLVANAWKLRGLWRRAVPVEAGVGVSSLLAVRGRSAELCTSEELDRPSLIGFFSPRIVIPRWLFERLSDGELRQIVMHEMEHLRRGDDWINLVQKLSLVAFPLNPALVWIERRLCLERELACDAGVIRATGAPKAYATCLTALAERSLDRRVAALTLGAWERRSQLAERVHGILRREKVLTPLQAGMVMSLAVAGLVVGAGELSRCPQLISFSAPVRVVAAQATAPNAGVPNGGMKNVVYRDGTDSAAMLPHETLLKASMDTRAAAPTAAKHSDVRKTSSPTKKHLAARRRLLMLSSWEQQDEMAAPRMTLTVIEGQDVSPSLVTSTFAVPTVGGWLVFQL